VAVEFARRAECYLESVEKRLAEIETAWLTGRPTHADEAIARLDELTARRGRETESGELNRWKRRLGRPHRVPPHCPEIWAIAIRGDRRATAAHWDALGAPYEQAPELLDSGELYPTLHALEILDDLGARPAAQLAWQQLRALGMSRIPRGPEPGPTPPG
jgi:hypothetical protein